SRPLIEWPRLSRLEIRGVVVLAKPGCPIAIVLQYLANRCLVPSHEAVIARKARRLLGDDPEAHRVMIATSDDRRPGRRAKCCRVEVGIAQTVGSDLIQGRRRDDTAERAGNAKTGFVGHNQEDVRCALGWHHACWPPGYRLRGVALDLAFELLLRRRQMVARDCRCRAWGARRSGSFLCGGRGGQCRGGKKGKRQGEQVCFHGHPPNTCCHPSRLF